MDFSSLTNTTKPLFVPCQERTRAKVTVDLLNQSEKENGLSGAFANANQRIDAGMFVVHVNETLSGDIRILIDSAGDKSVLITIA